MSLPSPRPDLAVDDNAAPSEAVCARAEVQRVRWLTGLTQRAFAETFAIDPDALRDVEAGRARPDPTLKAYLRTITRDLQAARPVMGAL